MAQTPYTVFLSQKAMQEVQQPGYSTDMRTIERGHNDLAAATANLPAEVAFLSAVVSALGSDITAIQNALPSYILNEFTTMLVGSPPPAGVQIKAFSGSAAVNFTSGNGSVHLGTPSWFTHGYIAFATVVAASGTANPPAPQNPYSIGIGNVIAGIWQGNSSLIDLWFQGQSVNPELVILSTPTTIFGTTVPLDGVTVTFDFLAIGA